MKLSEDGWVILGKHKTMKGKTITSCILMGLIFSNILALAREEDKNADKILTSMKIQLNLTSAQVIAVKPIISEYAYRRQDIMQSPETVLTPNKRRVHSQMTRLKEEEYKELSQVLTPDQMKRWDQSENVKDFLNQDETGNTDRTPQTDMTSF